MQYSTVVDIAPLSTLPAFIELLEQLGEWLWARGIKQWEPGSNRAERDLIESYLSSGVLLIARRDLELAGGCVVTRKPTSEWSFSNQPSAYLHKLAVSRHWAGKQLGTKLIEKALEWAGSNNLPTLRLDCWDGNQTLKRYYQKQGFAELQAVPSFDYQVRLFQRSVH